MSRKSKKVRVGNAQTAGAGASGAGDRGAQQHVAITSNPYFNNNFISRYQEFAKLYYTSWEAQKIVNIPVDDALREPFTLVGLEDNDSKLVMAAYQDIKALDRIRRAMYQERMLGGSVVVMGVRGEDADPAKPLDYRMIDTGDLRFLNTVSIDRITSAVYCADPFDRNYDSPTSYRINGQETHVSRLLIFDGEPVFSRDSATVIQNFRINPAGFGESKLAALYDTLIRMIGTQQGAYQLVNLASVLLAQCDNLMELQGTNAEDKLREVMNQISIYRAALITGKSVEIKQHSASFGSVPELVMTFAQLLSAASDIPATRYLSQAPGGLNATGDSDLENYYNRIGSDQNSRLKPQLIKGFDVLCPSVLGRQKWATVKEKFDIEFPPLWNLKKTEQATVDNTYAEMLKGLYTDGVLSLDQAIAEMKARGVFETNIQAEAFLDQTPEDEEPMNALGQLGAAA